MNNMNTVVFFGSIPHTVHGPAAVNTLCAKKLQYPAVLGNYSAFYKYETFFYLGLLSNKKNMEW